MCQGKVNNFLFKICLYPHREGQGTSLLPGGGGGSWNPGSPPGLQWPLRGRVPHDCRMGWGCLLPDGLHWQQWSWPSTAGLGHPLRGGRRGSSLLLRGSGSAEASVASTSTALLPVRDGSLSPLPDLPWPYSGEGVGVPCTALKGESLAPASLWWPEWR